MRPRALLVAAIAMLLAVAVPAYAYWSAGVTGSGGTAAGTLPAGEIPIAAPSGTSIAVGWAQSAIPGLGAIGALAGGGYVLTRYAEGSGTPIAPGIGCSGVLTGVGDPLTCTEAGVPEGRWVYTVSARYQSWVGAESAPSAAVVVDLTPPTTTAELAPPANAAGWNNGDVTVTLTAADNPGGSGVASIGYSAAGAEVILPTTYGAPFPITTEGITTLSFNATDVAGNVEAPQALDVRIDRTAPTGAVTAPVPGTAVTGTITVSSDSVDALSGVAGARFEMSPIGAGTWTEIGTATGAPFAVPLDTLTLPEGAYDLRVTTDDLAGNSFSSPPVVVIVDNLAPFGVDIQGANGGLVGTLDTGDTVTYTFSEPMLPGSILSGWDGSSIGVTVVVANGPADRLDVPDADIGRVHLGSRAVVGGNVRFDGLLAQAAPNTFVLTIARCVSGCGRVLSGVGPTTYEWRPSQQAHDLAGNRTSNAWVTQVGGPLQNM